MRLRALTLSLFVLLGTAAAQFTTVTGTVIDPNGLPYANGTIVSVLILPGGTSPTLNGLPYSPPTQPVGLSTAGSFSLRLGDNNVLLPAATRWNFTVCSALGSVQPAGGKGSVCFTLAAPITITGATQNISTQLNAVALPLTVNPGTGTISSIAGSAPITTTPNPIVGTGTVNCPTCAIGPGTSTAGNAAAFSGTDGVTLTDLGAPPVTHSIGALTANQLLIGNAGNDSKVLGSLGTTTAVLHGNAGGAPSFGAVNYATDGSGQLPPANGGFQIYGYNDYAAGVDGTGADQVVSSVSIPAIPAGRGMQINARFHTTSGAGTVLAKIKVGTTTVASFSTGLGTARTITIEVWNTPGSQSAQYTTIIQGSLFNAYTVQAWTINDSAENLGSASTVTATTNVASGTSTQAWLQVTSK